MFRITNYGTGFQVVFENGWMISVQFGTFNYCDNKFNINDPAASVVSRVKEYTERKEAALTYECANAEVAVIRPDGSFYPLGGDDGDTVIGYKTPDQVADLMAFVSACPALVELALDE